MKKYLFSIILSIVFLIPFTTQADIISTPSYQVDVTQPMMINPGGGSGDAAVAVQSTETMLRMQSVANITLEPAEILAESVKYNLHKSIAVAGIIGVSGGDSIGIRPIG